MTEERGPFRADHVGSLLRPKSLLKAREDHKAGRLPLAELRKQEDAAIRDAVKLQEDVGIKGVTDGEIRRHDWVTDFREQVGGVKVHPGEIGSSPFQTANGTLQWTYTVYTIEDKLSLDHPVFGDDFAFLKKETRQTAKLCIPSPSMMHGAGKHINRKVYPTDQEYLDDLSAIYAKEIAYMAGLGCKYLQLDDTLLAFLNSPSRREQMGAGGETRHVDYVKMINNAVAKRPKDMALTVHLCRGNFRSAWVTGSDFGYDHVAQALFGDLDVDGYFLEYDTERAGSFAPLRFLPKGNKRIVLGLVTTKTPELESKDALKRRIDEAAKYVPLEQLCLSPQCGFSSTEEGNELTIDQQRAKLQLVVDVAREVWG